jgi:hypothetical protein
MHHRGTALLAALLCLAAASCSRPADAVMAPPDPNNTLARPPENMSPDFCARLTPAQRASNQLCGPASPR